MSISSISFQLPLKKKDFIYLFLERGEGREEERERNSNVWDTHQLVANCTPPAGDLAHVLTQACALPGNQTGNPSVCRPALNPLSHTSQGPSYLYPYIPPFSPQPLMNYVFCHILRDERKLSHARSAKLDNHSFCCKIMMKFFLLNWRKLS